MELSNDDKLKLVSGKGMWKTNDLGNKIPSINFCDGPHGVRKEIDDSKYNASEEATCFPTGSCVASSWDTDLISQMAQALGREASNKGVSILLGPGINIKRLPICGRNFEYFSEDPYLSGILASSYVSAIQNQGVGACLKHFAANNQETFRQSANSQIDERALREIYLRAFEIAVKKSKPASIMAAYNRVNGLYACENNYLLNKILRQEWNYSGLIISDWSAVVNLTKALNAGLDLEMPDSIGLHRKELKKDIKNGLISQETIDRATDNILKTIDQYKIHDNINNFDVSCNKSIARNIAAQSAILLKNDNILPLDINSNKEIAIIGSLADKMRYQGSGSSLINSKLDATAIEALQEKGFTINYEPGYTIDSQEVDEQLSNRALDLVKKSSKVLFFGGLTDLMESEGFDRDNMKLPNNQIELLKEITAIRKDIIFVSFSGAPYEFDFIENIGAFLQMYLGGQGVGLACADILTGTVNPSGKLAESWPRKLEDCLAMDTFDPTSKDIQYRESLFVGYRYYDTYHIDTLFSFGQGLSYTQFTYSNLSLAEMDYENKSYRISLDLENTGNMKGKEVVQVYVKNPKPYFLRARRELRGFKKVELEVGEKVKLYIDLDENAFSIYDDRSCKYLEPEGNYAIEVGSGLSDIRLREEINLVGEKYHRIDRGAFAPFFVKTRPIIDEDTFKLLYGKKLSNYTKVRANHYSLYNSIDEMAEKSLTAKLLRKKIIKGIYKRYQNLGKDNNQVKMLIEAATKGPLDAVICQSEMPYLKNVGNAIVESCNDRKLKGFFRLFG